MKRFAIVLALVAAAYLIFYHPFQDWWPLGGQHAAALTEKIDQIDIRSENVRTEVVLGGGHQVRAEVKGRASAKVYRSGKTLQVNARRSVMFSGWWNAPKVTVTIPRDYAKTLNLNVASGDLNFTGDRETKYHRFATKVDSGLAQISNVSATSALLSVDSGDLRVKRLDAQQADNQLDSGNLDISDFSGAFTADVHSGHMKVGVKKLRGAVTATVNSGVAHFDLPDHADFRLDGKANSGVMRCTLPLKERHSEDGAVSGISGSGKNVFRATVNSGMMTIN